MLALLSLKFRFFNYGKTFTRKSIAKERQTQERCRKKCENLIALPMYPHPRLLIFRFPFLSIISKLKISRLAL